MCKVSVVVPAFNAEAYIEATLNSILGQDYFDIEIIVINDGSTDLTELKVKDLAKSDSRIKYLSQTNSGGPAKPRNVGIENAKGEYIFIFDADDFMVQGKIKKSVEIMDKNPSVSLLFSNFMSIDESGAILSNDYLNEYETFWRMLGDRGEDFYTIDSADLIPALVKVNFIGTSSVVLRRSALSKKNKFDESLTNADDYLFWIQFLKDKKSIFLNHCYHHYRILSTGISGKSYLKRGPSRIKVLKSVYAILKDKSLRKIITEKLAKEYCAMSYSYRREGDAKNQRIYALKSIRAHFNIRAIKLYFASFFIVGR